MAQNREELAALLTYLFTQDIRTHPMPPGRQRQLLETVRYLLVAAEQEGKKDRGKE